MGYVRDKERERAVTIVKVWNVLSVVTIVSQIAFIILYCIGVLQSAKIVFFTLGVLPWIRYLYGLIFSDITVWDEFNKKKSEHFIWQSAYWHEAHISFFGGGYSRMQMLIFSIDLLVFDIVAKVYKGSGKIFVLWFLIFCVMMTVGLFRIKGRDKLRQMLGFGLIMACFVFLTVNTTCFFLSSPAQHEACSYISKNKSSHVKGGTQYYVTVELENGDTYKCQVSSKLYKRAENAELVACHNEGPWGIEYLRVHEAQ